MKILYIGTGSGTSLQRAEALRRLGHEVLQMDPETDLPQRWNQWLHRQGGTGIDWLVARWLRRHIPAGSSFDLAHVNSGSVIGPLSIAVLRSFAPRISNYNSDNPYIDPSPERKRWTILRRALPGYDLVATTDRPGIAELMRKRGVRKPLPVWPRADEVVHAPVKENPGPWLADICFAGTWMPGREVFMEKLIHAGLDLAIYGPRWNKVENFETVTKHVRSSYLEGRDYALAVAGAKIGLVILNGKNMDLHTKRSVEIPSIGTAICAQRTPFHEDLYEEDSEALFFDNAEECAQKCKALLADPERLAVMTAAGQAKVRALKLGNESLMRDIVEASLT